MVCLPSVVPLHTPQASQMSQHAPDHSWDTGDTFEEDKSREPFLLRHAKPDVVFFAGRGMAISCYQVHSPPQHSDGSKRHPVRPVLGFSVGNFDLAHLFFGIADRY